MMTLTQDQQNAANKIIKWFQMANRIPYVTLGGYAGTGKTTLVSHIKNALEDITEGKLKFGFCSYTGKATQNLKSKLAQAKALKSKDKISTIHGLIYEPVENVHGVIVGWDRKDEIDVDLIIVDEASMIDQEIWRDLLSYNKPIIAIGDHGQLPPIKSGLNLMQKPMLRLETIHRQAQDNPIIHISKLARETGIIPAGEYGTNVIKYSKEDFNFNEANRELLENYNTDTLILCGYNATRNKVNQFVRTALGFEEQTPQAGDRVICLRNNRRKGIYNGMLGTILDIKKLNENWYEVDIKMDDSTKTYTGKLYAPQFGAKEQINFTNDRVKANEGDLFDFGYALTVHKAQGSQAKRVVLFEERFSKMDDDQWRRWLYTGVTRAQEELFVFGP